MARTLNGNETGAAAHRDIDSLDLTPNDQDKRIARMKTRLRFLMGEDAFRAFYVTTPFDGDKLEKILANKIAELEPQEVKEDFYCDYVAACAICTIAPELRVCDRCKFNVGLAWKALSAEVVPPEPIDLSQGSTQEWWDGLKEIEY